MNETLGCKVVNLIEVIRWCQCIKENELILNIFFDMCIIFLDVAAVDHLQYIHHIKFCCLPTQYIYMFYQ